MAIATSVIFPWTGTHAGIPAGWERETTLDAKYPKGTALGVDPNVTGGAATHTHAATASHTHTTTAHVHGFTYGGSSGTNVDSQPGSSGARNGHSHAAQNSGAVSADTVQTVASTYSEISNDPPYYEVIFIKPSAPANGVADDGLCFVDTSDTLGFTFCDGANSTPDLRNKYLKGAATNGNAGGTGGSLTNVHNLTHTHTTSHTHATVTTGYADLQNARADGSDMAHYTHTHTVTTTAVTPTTSDTPQLTTAETVEPAYAKLNPVQNKTGNALEKVGMIGMYLGALADIPEGWTELPVTRGKHLKCSNTVAEAGTTGGSNTHTHVAQYHTHTLASHNHTATASTFGANTRHVGNGQGGIVNHTHAVTVSSVAHTLANASTAGDSQSNEPPYRTVSFIKLVNIITGGSFLFNLL